MDPHRFGALARHLATVSRREAVRALAGGVTRRTVLRRGLGAAGGALATLGVGRAAAKRPKVGVCHRTGSSTTPSVFIKVDDHTVAAH